MNSFESIQSVFIRAARDLNIELSENELLRFSVYYRELLLWNNKTSLISITSPLDLPIKHFADSLTIRQFIPDSSASLLDIGAGAGFPSIPIKIIMNYLHVTIIEASRKKVSFLKTVTAKLCLQDITFLQERIETLKNQEYYLNSFDVITSRATFKLSYLLATASFFLSKNGILIAMKGKHFEHELNDARDVMEHKNIYLVKSHTIHLPILKDTRNILIFAKTDD